MATLTLSAEIKIISGSNSTIDNATTNIKENNISSQIDQVLGLKRVAMNPFIIGASKVGNQETYENNLNYVILSQLSDKDTGKFANDITITISGTNLQSFIIDFDIKNKQYPPYILVDGVRYEDTDGSYIIGGLTGNQHTITIQEWNKKGYPCVITGIYSDLSLIVDTKNLTEFSRLLKDRSDEELPSYGVIATNGALSFNDSRKEVLEYANQNLLRPDLKVNLYINNSLGTSHNLVGVFNTDKWNYSSDNFKVDVSLKDDLLEWQDILVNSFELEKDKNAKILFNKLLSITPTKYEFETPSQELLDYLENIKIDYFYSKNWTLWKLWDKLCSLALLRVYKNDNGKIEVSK